MIRTPFSLLTITLLLLLAGAVSAVEAAKSPVSYSRDIKPIFSNHCYACHGPDAAQRQADLRLDQRDVAIKEAIVPGKSAQSPLVARVITSDPDEHMPPADSKKPSLSPAQIELVKRWIDEGAKFDAHWAYQPPTRVAAPVPKSTIWAKNPIDAFIAAGHEQNGLTPSPEADRRTLIRRLSFDLLGLPPTPQDVEAFEKDASPEAYEKVVDRLLASEHYGERMAVYWLDLVRFADSAGYHSDNHRDVTPYRDYVIAAFNRNLPFDQFTTEQLAGDLLPNPTPEQRIASGYNRLLMTTEEGGAQAKEYTAKYAADRVRNVSTVWLGSTMGCSECHNHKFDPFTQKDFYALAAFFADVSEVAVGRQPQVKVPTSEQTEQIKKLDERLAALRKTLDTPTPELAAAQVKWEEKTRADVSTSKPEWNIVKPESTASAGGVVFAVQEDLSVLTSGENPAKDTYTVTLATDAEKITGIRLEALTHESFPNKSLSRGNGNFVLTKFEVDAASLGGKEAKPVKLAAAEADFSQEGFPVANLVDAKSNLGWAVNGHAKPENRMTVFTFAEPIPGGPATKIVVRLKHESQYAGHNIGRFRLALTTAAKPSLSGKGGLPADVLDALAVAPDQRNPKQRELLEKFYRSVAPELGGVRKEAADQEKRKQAIVDAAPMTLVSSAAAPRMMRILPRGNWLDDSGEEVQPGVPGFLPPLAVSGRRATRLDLARWVVSPENPIPSRVFVNRAWKLVFGQGISKSLDDCGSQGTLPSHPELLDWLAVEFRESGWNVKQLMKTLVMTSAYRQSSLVSAEAKEKDPTNIWLARQSRFRLDAEMVRDNALSVSGLLVPKIGGPSVKPYQPAGYWQYLNFPTREWQNDKGDGLYRRGMYTYWQRTFVQPSLLAFDAPSREECTVERVRSNTPLQALVLLNDPTYVEAARALAARTLRDGGADTAARINFAFRQATSREPRAAEAKILADLFAKHLAEYTANKAAASDVQKNGDFQPPAGLDPAELAAWTSVARVILNLHETITRN